MGSKIAIVCAPVFLFFLLLFVFVKLVGPVPFALNSVATTKTDTFTVDGQGKAEVPPDIANVSVGVTANGTTVKQTQDQLNSAINKVSAAIKKVGIVDADIKTENYNISPNYDYRASTQTITGYTASTNLAMTVRNLDNVNAVIDAATQNGANQVGGVSFDVSDKTKAQDQARQKAVADAKQKAQEAAKIAGFHLGAIVNYTENFNGQPYPYPKVMMNSAQGAPTAPTNVQPGSSEIQVSVTLSYDIR